MKTIIVWYRNDLRIHDHPALATAHAEAEHVLPLFILDDIILKSEKAGANRNRFLLESLQDLKDSFKARGADLVIRHGKPQEVLAQIAQEVAADAIYYTADYTPYAIERDKALKQQFDDQALTFRAFPGRLIVSSIDKLHTKAGTKHKVFTPFYRNWLEIVRREVATTPQKLQLPSKIEIGELPPLESITNKEDLSPDVVPGGETAGRKRLHAFIENDLANYKQASNDMAADKTSRLSSYLHFGCLSPREIETMLPHGTGADAWRRQLCWREFYHYVLFNNPSNTKQEFQERYRQLKWGSDKKLLAAWQEGKTGYPVVDAAMRQLRQEGWMHNRARLIVGSFLTKDLWLDWRLGETYFMKMLVDGDMANNNGNWQWIASVGVDPAPVFRRMYNPTSQQGNYDPSGAYVRKYVPELKDVPDKYLAEPWKMSEDDQKAANCIISKDYQVPIVDHAVARQAALEHYRSAS